MTADNNKVGNKDKNEWDFNKLQLSDVPPPPAPKQPEKTLTKHKIEKPVNKKLILDEAPPLKTKTRSELASAMKGTQDEDDSDIYKLASIPKRAIAFLIDICFLLALIYSVDYAAPYLRKLIQFCLDQYKLVFLIPESFVMKLIFGLSGFIAIFFMIIIPVSFFNHSFGKKILGLKVRGKEKYTLTLSEAFKRELIMKPISVIIIAGFVTPFFSKNRLSIHDMLSETLVIED